MSLTEEESNFFRFYFLNLKIATKAVRVYFDKVHPPAGLGAELIKSSVTLKGLRFMTKLQLDILYPSPGQTVTSAEFDTTLIVCLLRNLPPRESAPVTGWDNLPHPNDNSTGADLARVKWYRNQSVHSKDGILSPTDFSQFWGDLEGAIGRLGGPSMLQEAQSGQHFVLDRALIDILNALGNSEKDLCNLLISHEKHTRMTNDLLLERKFEEKLKEIYEQMAKMSKEIDDMKKNTSETTRPTTICSVETMHVLTEVSQSVGYISGPRVSGTCWRVGNDKIITAAHVVKDNIWNNILGMPFEQSLKDICVDFDYIREKSSGVFKIEPRVLFMDDSLDVAVLQLKPDNKQQLPPSLKMFERLDYQQDEDKHIYLISHNKGVKKEVNLGIGLWNPTEKRKEDLKDICKKYGEPDGYKELDRKDRLIVQCDFVGGASGSPGIVIYNNVAHVVFVYIRGFPSFYYKQQFPEEQRRKFPKDKLLQQGVNIGCLFDTMSKNAVNLTLRNEIFPVEVNLEQHQFALTSDKTSINRAKTSSHSVKDREDSLKSEMNIPICTNQGGSKQKRLEEDTTALIEEDVKEGTFVATKAVTNGLLLLKQNGVLLITGYAGTGKSRIGRHVLHMFCTENKSFKCMKLTLAEWDNMSNREEKKDNKEETIDNRADKVVLLLDDIFGETNCIYNGEKDTPILDKIYAYVCKGNIKVIITIRDTVKRQCQEMFESHRLFKFDFIDLSSDKYLLSQEEKHTILMKYMNKVRQSDYIKSKGFVHRNGHLILKSNEVSNISRGNPVKGFPLVVYQFVHNDKYFKLGSKFFDRPTEAMLEEMNAIRRKGEDQSNDKRKCMIQYAVMVYTAINENRINPDDNSCGTEISKVINAIYGGTTEIKKCHILDAVKNLKGSYLVNIPNQRSYKLHHPTLQESVILSFAQIDEKNIDKIIPLISWSFFLKMVKPESYTEKEGEVVLRVPINSYQLLANRLVDFYMPKVSRYGLDTFISSLCNTEIFQEENCLLLPCLLEALQKEDGKVEHTENMIRSNEMDNFNSYLSHIKKKNIFLANLLISLAMLEGQLELYNFTLKTFKTIVKTNSHQFTIDYMKSSLISSLCNVCSTKDVINVKATLDIIEEHKIPVLLDQGVKLTNNIPIITSILNWSDNKPYVCLALCIWNAYEVFNIPVLEFLLSKYIQTPFDINLFFKMIYSKEMYGTTVLSFRKLNFGNPSLSSLPLKWMIESFRDQELEDLTLMLRTACKYQMFDTVEYLASRCKTFDAVSCLQAFVDMPMGPLSKDSFNRELFSFLLKKVDISSKGLIPVVMSITQKNNVPDYMFDALLPICLHSTDIFTLACKNGQFYLVNLIIESSRIENLDIQSALMAACMECQRNYDPFFYLDINLRNIEIQKLNIVQYIVEKIGFDQFDLKAVCQQACASKQIKIIEWFVQNIDTTRLDVQIIIDAALINKRSDMLEHIMKNIDLKSLDKRRVLKSVTEQYTAECSTTILEIVCTIWDSTEDKEVLHMEEIVNTAYEMKHFELLMWIHDKCHPHVSIDSKKVIILAVEDARVDVVKWASQTFKQTSLDNNEGKIFIKLCSKMFFDFRFSVRGVKMGPELIDTVLWILTNFQIKQSDIVSGVLKLTCVNRKIGNDLISNLVILILENHLSCLEIDDIKDLIYKSIQNKCYVPVNWFLEKRGSLSYDKQMILNNACADQEIDTIKILSKYFYTLDMNQAMIKACTSTSSPYEVFIFQQKDFNNNQSVACLNLLWKEINKIDHDNIDLNTIVSKVCEVKKVSNNVMTWILLNFPLDKIPINEVLTTCCQQRKIQHVKYIFQEVDNEKLDIREAFVRTCLAAPGEEKFLSKYDELNIRMNAFEFSPMSNYEPYFLMIIDYVFQKLHDKDYCVSLVVNEIVEKKKFNLILYFRQAGYCRHIDMKNLLNEACGHGHVKLVIWILGNVEHKELDITSAFHAACDSIVNYNKHLFQDNEERVNHVMCVALLWHYIHDINMFEIYTVLKPMTESQSDTSVLDYKHISIDKLKTWLLYIKKINQRICQSDNALLSSEENINLKRQVNDRQCCEQDPQENNELNSSIDNDDCLSPTKRLCLEKEQT